VEERDHCGSVYRAVQWRIRGLRGAIIDESGARSCLARPQGADLLAAGTEGEALVGLAGRHEHRPRGNVEASEIIRIRDDLELAGPRPVNRSRFRLGVSESRLRGLVSAFDEGVRQVIRYGAVVDASGNRK